VAIRVLTRRSLPSSVVKVLVLLGAGVILLGCGSGPSATTTTTTSSTTSTTELTTTSPSTSTTIGLQACSTGVLSASAASAGIAAGTGYETFMVTNGGPSACFVKGYATVELFGPSAAGGAGVGPRLTVTVARSGVSAAQITLATHRVASFSMRYSNEPVGGGGCETVASAEITLPGDTETLSFPVSLTICGGSVQIGPYGPPGAQTP
jgi:Protein of unknown function (DUF4232)